MVFVTGALGINDNIFVMKIFQDVVQDVCPLPHHQNQTVKLSEMLHVYPISLRWELANLPEISYVSPLPSKKLLYFNKKIHIELWKPWDSMRFSAECSRSMLSH